MITGDNTLTGSNISYKCEISNKAKQMLICDYENGKFSEQNFTYDEEEDNSTDVTAKNVKKPEPIDNKITPADSTTAINKVHQIELKTKEGSSNIYTDPNAFIDYMSFKAENSNSQLCVTGRAFNRIFDGMIVDVSDEQKRFMRLATVFARTKPNDKAKIVMAFQHMDLKVSMCGDGANDCGALKQADIGLSLSQAEASISAPFTSQVANISSMVELIKECRCGLATNFTLFNVMAIYSLIQYTTTVICLKYLQYPGDFHYLYWDLVLNFGYILFIGNTATAKELSVDRPRSSLFCFTNLFQMVFAFAVQVAGQISWIAIY